MAALITPNVISALGTFQPKKNALFAIAFYSIKNPKTHYSVTTKTANFLKHSKTSKLRGTIND